MRKIKAIIHSIKPKLLNIFTHLHSHPEVSWEEYETTKYIYSLLEPLGCRVTKFEGMTGLVAEIGEGKPVVALRADIDALWQEVDGKFQANHSCGHDAHMTIVIGVLLTLIKKGFTKKGTFRFIFQPAEEKGTGALAVLERDVIDDVDFLYGLHLRPIQELKYGQFSPAIEHGAARFISGVIEGEDAHGARPHLNANSIQVGTDFFQKLNGIQIDPAIPHSVKMTAFQAGGKNSNIIPGNASFSIDIRSQTNDVMELLTRKVEKIASFLASYYNVKIKLTDEAYVPASVTSQEAIEIMSKSIIDSVGEEKLTPNIQTTGGDDFHFYTIKRPHLKATMLAIGCDLKPGLHHPNMTFKKEVIPEAVEIVSRTLINTVEKYSSIKE